MREKFKSIKEKITSSYFSFLKNNLSKIRNLIEKFKNFHNKENFQEKISQAKDELCSSLKDDDYKREIRRKSFHMLSILLLPISYIFLQKSQMLNLLIPIAFLMILADFIRQRKPKFRLMFNVVFGRIMRQKELSKDGWLGSSATLLSVLLVLILSPKIIAICAFVILAISDGLAALIGKKVTSGPFFEKSLAGSIAFGFSAFVILIICGILSSQGFGYYLFGILAVFCVTIIEARPSFLGIDDNLSIPVVFSAIMVFFGLIWGLNY